MNRCSSTSSGSSIERALRDEVALLTNKDQEKATELGHASNGCMHWIVPGKSGAEGRTSVVSAISKNQSENGGMKQWLYNETIVLCVCDDRRDLLVEHFRHNRCQVCVDTPWPTSVFATMHTRPKPTIGIKMLMLILPTKSWARAIIDRCGHAVP
eukprot:68654-Chlamydomonas_euryale.AAC.4